MRTSILAHAVPALGARRRAGGVQVSPSEPPGDAVRIVRRRPLASMIACIAFLALSPEAPGEIATGTYTGNGTTQSITDIGFQPDVVIVKRYPHRKAYMRTSTMPAGLSKMIKKPNALETDGITSLDATGFTVGNLVHVNGLNDPYYWIAFKQEAGVCEVGTYTGTPAAQTVPVAFQPDYVIVVPEAEKVSVHRSSAIAGDNTFSFEGKQNPPILGDYITALVATGFDVGMNASVNTNGAVHHYVAFKVTAGKVAVGSYQGDGSDGRSISVGFQPEWVLIHADTAVTVPDGSPGTIHRPASMSGDISLNMTYSEETTTFDNCLQALNATGFEVGSDDTVNKGPSGPNYYWMAFGPASAPPQAVVNYRSIGTDTGTVYSTGNATVATGSSTVTFASGASLPANVGKGDKLTIGSDTYYIVSKDSPTQVTVHAASASPYTNTAYTITRAYNTLQAWETARQGDLVTDNRQVWVARLTSRSDASRVFGRRSTAEQALPCHPSTASLPYRAGHWASCRSCRRTTDWMGTYLSRQPRAAGPRRRRCRSD